MRDYTWTEIHDRVQELETENARLREAIETHRRNVWGDKAVGHSEDRDLYEALEVSDE